MEEALTALLAGIADGRCHWGRAPQGSPLPYVEMARVTGLRDYTMRGASGLTESRVQLDCYGSSYTQAKETARSVITTVSGHSDGDLLGIFVEAERDLTEADAGEVEHLFRISIDITVHARET